MKKGKNCGMIFTPPENVSAIIEQGSWDKNNNIIKYSFDPPINIKKGDMFYPVFDGSTVTIFSRFKADKNISIESMLKELMKENKIRNKKYVAIYSETNGHPHRKIKHLKKDKFYWKAVYRKAKENNNNGI